MPYYVYMLECSNGSYYTGYTTDLARRYKEHEQGSDKCRYTRSFPPKKLVTFWILESKSVALCIEAKIKKLHKHQKLQLIDMDAASLIKHLEFKSVVK